MNRLKFIRQIYNKDINDLCKLLNIDKKTYLDIENGIINITSTDLIKLSNYYQVNIDYILNITDISNLYPKSKNSE